MFCLFITPIQFAQLINWQVEEEEEEHIV